MYTKDIIKEKDYTMNFTLTNVSPELQAKLDQERRALARLKAKVAAEKAA